MTRRLRSGALLLAVLALATGCRADGLQFTQDRRVTWVTEDNSVQTLPLQLEWELDGFEMTGPDGSEDPDAGFVAVFVDARPPAPGASLASLAEDDDGCRPDDGCPGLTWFTDRGIYPVAEGTSLTIDRLPPPSDTDRRELHDLTLVLLDGQGKRQGESAFRITVEIDRT